MADMKRVQKIGLIIVALAAAAMVLADLAPMFATAAELSPAPVAARAQDDGVVLLAQAEPQQQKPKKRKTLLEMLFGGDDDAGEAESDQQNPQQKAAPKAKSAAPAPPPPPKIPKAENATRVAVFGDSLADDVARGLDRFYAEDPNLTVIAEVQGNSGLVRPDYFDWPKKIADEIAAQSFDIAVIVIGINDRQTMNLESGSFKSLTPEWRAEYSARATRIVQMLRAANKPVIWVGLPPMQAPKFGQAMIQVNEIQRLAAFGGGAEFLDIYDKFADEDGKYATRGPDLSGNVVRMRKDDGIHFSTGGAAKLAFYLSQSLRTYYRGGGAVGLAVADPLDSTEAQAMLRPPYQGLGQMKLLEVAGAVISLTHAPRRAAELISAGTAGDGGAGFDMSQLVEAPEGRADAFGVGKVPVVAAAEKPLSAAVQ